MEVIVRKGETSKADKLFDAQVLFARLEMELWDFIQSDVFGVALEKAEKQEEGYCEDFEDYHFDYYDKSLELGDCIPELRLSKSQRQKLFDYGFHRVWLNHIDGSETAYHKNDINYEGRKGKRK